MCWSGFFLHVYQYTTQLHDIYKGQQRTESPYSRCKESCESLFIACCISNDSSVREDTLLMHEPSLQSTKPTLITTS